MNETSIISQTWTTTSHYAAAPAVYIQSSGISPFAIACGGIALMVYSVAMMAIAGRQSDKLLMQAPSQDKCLQDLQKREIKKQIQKFEDMDSLLELLIFVGFGITTYALGYTFYYRSY